MVRMYNREKPSKRKTNLRVIVTGERICDSRNGKFCHQCRQKTMDFVASSNVMNKQCTIKFCHKSLSLSLEGEIGRPWMDLSQQSGSIESRFVVSRSVSSPLMAEALAVLSAMQHALQVGFTNLHIASDSAQLIKALKSKDPISELYGIHYDILDLSLNFSFVSFNFIALDLNEPADALAKEALRSLELSFFGRIS